MKCFPCFHSLSLLTYHRMLCSLDAEMLATTVWPLAGATNTWCMHTPQAAQRLCRRGRKAMSLSPEGHNLCAETLCAWTGGGLEGYLQSPKEHAVWPPAQARDSHLHVPSVCGYKTQIQR